MNKEAVVHLLNRILLSSKQKEGNLAFYNGINRPREYWSSEISQSEKDKYHMISLVCGL